MVKDNTPADEQWKLARSGKFTASSISKIMLPGKDNMFSKGGLTYINEVACDAYTLFEDRNVQTYSMMMGKIKEPEAFAFYSKLIGLNGLQYFGDGNPLFKEYCKDSGGSPDAIAPVDADTVSFGGEFKCPDRDTHWDYLKTIKDQYDLKKLCPDYYGQCEFLMRTFKCDLWHWVSYNEYFPLKDRALIIEVKWDKNYQNDLEVRLQQAIKMKYELIEQFKTRS